MQPVSLDPVNKLLASTRVLHYRRTFVPIYSLYTFSLYLPLYIVFMLFLCLILLARKPIFFHPIKPQWWNTKKVFLVHFVCLSLIVMKQLAFCINKSANSDYIFFTFFSHKAWNSDTNDLERSSVSGSFLRRPSNLYIFSSWI